MDLLTMIFAKGYSKSKKNPRIHRGPIIKDYYYSRSYRERNRTFHEPFSSEKAALSVKDFM